MTWAAALRWALTRARDTGEAHRVYGYLTPLLIWRYAVGKACRCEATQGAACPQHGYDDDLLGRE